MVTGKPFEISEEVYKRAMDCNGYITSADKNELFPEYLLCGYGVYSAMAYKDKETGKYMCRWDRGDSCD
jgi:hypothetical protein